MGYKGFYDMHGTTLHLFVMLFPVQYMEKRFTLETREYKHCPPSASPIPAALGTTSGTPARQGMGEWRERRKKEKTRTTRKSNLRHERPHGLSHLHQSAVNKIKKKQVNPIFTGLQRSSRKQPPSRMPGSQCALWGCRNASTSTQHRRR